MLKMAINPKIIEESIPKPVRFLAAGMAGITSIFFVHPFDLIKTRLQTQGSGTDRLYKNPLHCAQTVIANEGFKGLYKGLGAAILRQATYTTTRLGVYSVLEDMYKDMFNKEPALVLRMAMGLVSGGIGSFIGTPADVVLVRMAADGRLPLEKRRNYTNVFNGLFRIVREEGLLALWRGCIPTITRAMVVNMVQLSSYSSVKSSLINNAKMEDDIKVHLISSVVAGFLTAFFSMPVDICKTRIQTMKYTDGKPEYKGSIDVLIKVSKSEGIKGLYKGFLPYFLKVGNQTILTFIIFEYYIRLYKKYSAKVV